MNEIFLAANKSVKSRFLDGEIEIRQIRVCDIDDVEAYAKPIRRFLNNDFSAAKIKEVLHEHLPQCIGLITFVTDTDTEHLADMALIDVQQVVDLLQGVLLVNKAYFKQDSKQSNDNSTLFDAFQTLIANGHSHDSIMQMSYGAFIAYLQATAKAVKREIRIQANTMRVAYHGGKRDFKGFVDGLG